MTMEPAIRSFYHAPTGTWSHLVWDPAGRKAALIDPVLDYDPAASRSADDAARAVAAAIEEAGLDLAWVLETHAHADHLTAAQWFRERFGCAVGIGEGIRDVQAVFRDVYDLGDGFPVDGSQFDRLLADGDALPLGGLTIRILHTPGHTTDSVTYLIGRAAFIGDTLFSPAYGTARCDFPGGDAARLYRSIHRLFGLGDDVRLYLCHDYPAAGETPRASTSVSEQRDGNVHVGGGTTEREFVEMRARRDESLPMPALMLPAVQLNIRAGCWPDPAANGTVYLKIPVNRF
jgi:glyoxylase-like metal-dependent hydrolase (beta-lactamase superfamily II)